MLVEAAVGEWVPLDTWRRLPAIAGVYVIRHRATSREYVGKSVNVRGRMYYHERAKDKGTAIHAAIRKYGAGAFDVAVIAIGAEAALNALEVKLIADRGSYAKVGGFNLTLGGEGFSGRVFTDAQRKALGDIKRGHVKSAEALARVRESCLRAAAHLRGKPRTAEDIAKMREGIKTRPTHFPTGPRPVAHCEAISAAKRGRKTGADNPKARPVGVWLPDSMTPLTFDTARLAAAFLGVSPRALGSWCLNKHHCPYAFQVAYL